MPRKPDGKTARNETLHVRIAEDGLAVLDEFRGSWSRSHYIRQCVAYAIKNGMKGPEEVEW